MGPHVIFYPAWNASSRRERPLASNGALGMAIFLLAETMFFAGLISAYWVLRSGSGAWPPPGQPRLPWEATACSTFLLFLSEAAILGAWRFAAHGRWISMKRALGATLGLGAAFLAIQGYEWFRLVGFGLKVAAGTYGGSFYLLIGCHAVHVAAGLAYLAWTTRRLGAGSTAPAPRIRMLPALMYWTFVVAVWPVLYALVYF